MAINNTLDPNNPNRGLLFRNAPPPTPIGNILSGIGGAIKGAFSAPPRPTPAPTQTQPTTGYNFSNYSPMGSITGILKPGALTNNQSTASPAQPAQPKPQVAGSSTVKTQPTITQPTQPDFAGQLKSISDQANNLKTVIDQQAAQEQQKSAAANTFSGGVNSSGQALPGFTPQSSQQTPGLFPSVASSLAGLAGGQSPQFQQAQQQYLTAAQQLADLKSSAASAPFIGAGTSLSEYAGTQGLLGQRLALQEQALTGEMSAAQQAAQVATGQQLAQQSGLNQAGGLVQPQLGQYGQTYYQPLQAGQGGGTSGDINSMIDYWATQIATNKASINDVPATISGNVQLKTQLQQAIQQKNPNYNPTVQQSQQASAGDMSKQISSIQSTLSSADASFSLLINTAKEGGVVDTNVPILNTLQQNIGRGLASAQSVTGFQSLLSGIRDQYASILGGGTATDQTRSQAAQQIPDNVSLAALQNIQQLLKAEGNNRIQGLKDQINQQTGGNASGGTPNPWK